MLSPPQIKKYWRRWSACSAANDWRGIVTGDGAKSEFHQLVWRQARALANADFRAVNADDLRHACHVVACGRAVSHRRLSNADFSRLLVWWGDERAVAGLLIDPEDLASLIAWQNPDLTDRDFLCAVIRRTAPFALIDSVARHNLAAVYSPPHWDQLDHAELIGLLRVLKKIQSKKFAEPNAETQTSLTTP